MIASNMKGKSFQQKQTDNNVEFGTIPKDYNLYYNISTFVSPIYTFSLAGNIIVYTRQFKVQIGKSTLNILSIKEKCLLWREINTSPSISSSMDRVFSIFRQKNVRV